MPTMKAEQEIRMKAQVVGEAAVELMLRRPVSYSLKRWMAQPKV